MALRVPRQLLVVVSCAVVTIGACTSDRAPTGPVVLGEVQQDTHDHGKTAKVSQDLSLGNFQGTSLPAKTLALTFDDGPGPRTKELSIYLKSVNIRAAFFMNGARLAATALPNPNGIAVVADPAGTLAQVLADGHLVSNHTTTHRNLTSEVPDAQRVQELSDTDTDIAGSVSPPNHLLFRAPYGAFNGTVFNTLSASTMNKYIGPIYWEAGGFSDGFPNRAADWACWQGQMKDGANALISVGNDPGFATTTQCGDAYVKEIDNVFPKGIVLMHDPYAWSKNGLSGSTVDMVKYIVPILIGKGYSFVRVDEVPDIAAALPCHTTCATCSGPSATQCTSCASGKYVSGGQCVACGTCGASEYQVSACSTSANVSCAACSATCGTCTGPSATECASCTANKYLSGGACTACSVCGPSTYQSAACTATANTVCGACDASCTACSGPNPNQCGSCPTAFFLSGGGCNACKVCEIGTFQATACTTTANTLCTACPAGTSASAAGAASCTPCAAGTSAAAGAATCSACPAGTTAGPGAVVCTACGSCDDGNACTADRCDVATGCVHDPIASCGVDSGTSGGLRDDVEGGPAQPAASENGCSITGQLGHVGSGHAARGLFFLAALGMSRLVRRRKSPRQHTT